MLNLPQPQQVRAEPSCQMTVDAFCCVRSVYDDNDYRACSQNIHHNMIYLNSIKAQQPNIDPDEGTHLGYT